MSIRIGSERRKGGQELLREGKAWCSYGRHEALLKDFYSNEGRRGGVAGNCIVHTKEYFRLYNYGLTKAVHDRMLSEQGGKCAICQEVPDEELMVDHDHGTGEVRGLLCRSCNWGIGHLRDSPERLRAALSYLGSD